MNRRSILIGSTTIPLAACGATGGTTTLPADIQAFIDEVQQGVTLACGFLPTVGGILALIGGVLPGAGGAVAVIQSICDALGPQPAVRQGIMSSQPAKGKPAYASVKGKLVPGIYVR